MDRLGRSESDPLIRVSCPPPSLATTTLKQAFVVCLLQSRVDSTNTTPLLQVALQLPTSLNTTSDLCKYCVASNNQNFNCVGVYAAVEHNPS